MARFITMFEDAVPSWSSAFVEANYKPDQTVLSGEVFASVSQYPDDPYSTLKVYTGRPDGWSELGSNLSAYTVLDINVVAFKFDEDLKVRGNSVALDHQIPQAPYDPGCRSPVISSNNILSGLAYDTLEPISSLAPLSAFADFDQYIDSRLKTMPDKFGFIANSGSAMQDTGSTMQDNESAMQDNRATMQDSGSAMQDNGEPRPVCCPENTAECKAENRFRCAAFMTLPEDLQAILRQLRRRSAPGTLEDLICRVCSVRNTSRTELVCFLGRNETYVRGILKRLLEKGRLAHVIPEMPKHPKQAYMAVQEGLR